MTTNQHKLAHQVEQVGEALGKTNKVISRNFVEHGKTVKFTEALEERILDATRLIVQDQEDIRALNGEVAGVREAMDASSKQLQGELSRQKKMILENMNKAIGLADEITKTRTRVEVGEFK